MSPEIQYCKLCNIRFGSAGPRKFDGADEVMEAYHHECHSKKEAKKEGKRRNG